MTVRKNRPAIREKREGGWGAKGEEHTDDGGGSPCPGRPKNRPPPGAALAELHRKIGSQGPAVNKFSLIPRPG